MTTESVLTNIAERIESIARLLLDEINSKPDCKNWSNAKYVVAFGDGMRRSNLTINNKNVQKMIHPPLACEAECRQLGQLRQKLEKCWNSFELTISPKGECKTQFLYDQTQDSFSAEAVVERAFEFTLGKTKISKSKGKK